MSAEVVEIEAFGDEERVLCADEACIGLLGKGGCCKVCGRAGGALSDEPIAPSAPAPEEIEGPKEPLCADDDFAARRLCPDGGCIGLLGEDDRCKVCGLRA